MPPTASKSSKLCRVCANSIPAQASYCTHCESFQNWRRHLQLGQATLPMLVALVAVLSTLVPPAMQLLSRPNSRLVVSGLSASAGALNLTFSNLGDRPAVIDQVVLAYAVPQASRSSQMLPMTFAAPDDPVVVPSEVRKLVLSVTGDKAAIESSWLPAAATLYDQPCTVSVGSTAFDGTASDAKLIAGCRDILGTLFSGMNSAFQTIRLERLKANPVPLPAPGN